jgi:hypothetical protein
MSGTGANMVKAEEIANKAASLVAGDRAATHGDKAINFRNIADMWNAWLDIRFPTGPLATLTPADVAKLMALLKIARMESGQYNADDAVDAVGYIAISGELSQPPVPDYAPIGTKR